MNIQKKGLSCSAIVCKDNKACDAMMPDKAGGVCYKDGLVVRENYQICEVTNVKIREMLKEKKPEATFSCNVDRKECNFQCLSTLAHDYFCIMLILFSLGGSS